MRIFLTSLFVISCFAFPIKVSQAQSGGDCFCVPSEAVKKYCEQEKSSAPKTETRIAQESIARRDIQKLINQGIEADIAKDAKARSSHEAGDLTIKELDGRTYSSAQIGASLNNYQGILRISDETRIGIECLTLKGKEAIVYVNQHFVRYVPDRKDESPHEVITNIVHRETWIFTEQGWKLRYIEELERGKTYLNGKLYTP